MMNFYTAGLGEQLSEEKPICVDCGYTKCPDGTVVTAAYTQFHLDGGENGKYCSIVVQVNEDTELNNLYDATKALLMKLGIPAEFIKRRD